MSKRRNLWRACVLAIRRPPRRSSSQSVPLSPRAVEIVNAMPRNSEFVFTSTDGRRGGKQIGRDAFKDTLKALAVDATPHGFRSTFADWAADRTNYPREVREQCLAHAIENKVERAYRRGDLFDKRRKLMDAWAAYCAKIETDGKVIALARARTPP